MTQQLTEQCLTKNRPSLYDYLLRMSADANKCTQVIDSAETNLLSHPTTNEKEKNDIRCQFFSICRRSFGAGWGRDVSKLEPVQRRNLGQDNQSTKPEMEILKTVDLSQKIADLSPDLREVIYLTQRYEFTPAQAAQIIGVPTEDITTMLRHGLQTLSNLLKFDPSIITKEIYDLPRFDEPELFAARPTDLFLLARNLKKRTQSNSLLVFMTLIALAALGVVLYHTGIIGHLWFSTVILTKLLFYYY